MSIEDLQKGPYLPTYTVGDKIKYGIVVDDIDLNDAERYKIKWYIMASDTVKLSEDDWTKPVLEFELTEKYRHENSNTFLRLLVEVLDTKTGLTSIARTTSYFKIVPKYDLSGFYILSEDAAGNAKFSFLVEKEYEAIDDPIIPSTQTVRLIDFDLYYNVYETSNAGMTLKGSPIKIEPFYYSSRDIQTAIFTKGGLVDVEKAGLTQDVDFANLFEGGTFPEGVEYFTGGQFMWILDVLTDQLGRLFFRYRIDDDVYHAGVFDNDPIKYKGEVLEGCKVFRTHTAEMPGAFVYHPKGNEILYVLDGREHGGSYNADLLINAGKITELPELRELGLPEGFYGMKNLDNCTIYNIENSGNNNNYYTYVALKDNTTGKYIIEQYEFQKGYYMDTYELISHRQFNVTGLPNDIDYIYLPNLWGVYAAYAVKGNELYFINLELMAENGKSMDIMAEKYFIADSKINSVSTENERRSYLLLGTEGGYVYIIDCNGAKHKVESRLPSEDKIIFKHKVDNKVIDLKWKWTIDLLNYK